MKKLLTVILATIIFVFALTGCAGKTSPVQDRTEQIMTAIKEGNTDYLSKLSDVYATDDQTNYLPYQNVIESYKPYIKTFTDNFSYEIKEIDDKKLTSTVKVTYIDGDELYSEIFQNDMKGLDDTITPAIESVDTSKTITETITLEFKEKDDGVILKAMSDELYNIVTLGIYKPISDLMSNVNSLW